VVDDGDATFRFFALEFYDKEEITSTIYVGLYLLNELLEDEYFHVASVFVSVWSDMNNNTEECVTGVIMIKHVGVVGESDGRGCGWVTLKTRVLWKITVFENINDMVMCW